MLIIRALRVAELRHCIPPGDRRNEIHGINLSLSSLPWRSSMTASPDPFDKRTLTSPISSHAKSPNPRSFAG